MRLDKTQMLVGATLVGGFLGFWKWHTPSTKPLTAEETEQYLERISQLPLPGDETQKVVNKLRAWAADDDGKPTYMLNLIRYFPELRRWPGAPEFDGTPEQANAYYEKSITALWLKNASYPMVGGTVQGSNLIGTQEGQADWSTAQMVHYPSRRKFLQLLAEPSYRPYEPYKFMALELDLIPVSGDKVIPDLRWAVGAGLAGTFLATGWIRASRHR